MSRAFGCYGVLGYIWRGGITLGVFILLVKDQFWPNVIWAAILAGIAGALSVFVWMGIGALFFNSRV